jgi:hypothetical protein
MFAENFGNECMVGTCHIWMTAWTLEGLGRVSYLAGESRKAEAHFRAAIALFDLLGERGNASFMLSRQPPWRSTWPAPR